MTSAVALRGASVRRGHRFIWSDADLEVERHRFVAILGPNGAGKSSLLDVVLGQLALSSGSAEVLGRKPGETGTRIGYLPQRRSFDNSLRVRGRDLVQLGLDGNRWGVPLPPRFSPRRRSEAAVVDDVLDRVDGTALADRPIGLLSGGEQQRLLIAQALVRQPELLLLDEPLDSLDLPNQAAIATLVRSVAETGTTVLMVAHDVNPILPFLDQVIYVARGRVVSGTPEAVVRSEVLSDLYQTPVDVLRASDGRLVVVGAPDGHTHHAHH